MERISPKGYSSLRDEDPAGKHVYAKEDSEGSRHVDAEEVLPKR